MISNKLKAAFARQEYDVAWSISEAHPEFLVANGSHGIVVFNKYNGMRIMATECDCSEGPCCYGRIFKADLEEYFRWNPAPDKVVDILGIGYTKINGVIVPPDYKWREIIREMWT